MDGKGLGNTEERKYGLSFKHTNSKTEQHHRDGTQVDRILKQYQTKNVNTNDVGLFRHHVIANMDFGVQPDHDYQQQLNRMIEIKKRFDRLPADIRERFRNDPARMVAWTANPKNLEAAIKLGLITAPEEKKEPATPAPNSTPPAAPGTDTKPK